MADARLRRKATASQATDFPPKADLPLAEKSRMNGNDKGTD